MIRNRSWLEDNLILLSVQLPIETSGLKHEIDEIFSGPRIEHNASIYILVDASHIHPPVSETDIQVIQTLLLNLQSRGPVIVFSLSGLLEHLLKLTLLGHSVPQYPIDFAANQDLAIAIVHRLMALSTTNPNPTTSTAQKPKFSNAQSEALFQAFVRDANCLRNWRQMVDGIYEDGEVVFETVMFAARYHLGNTKDMTINWDQVIMALLNASDK